MVSDDGNLYRLVSGGRGCLHEPLFSKHTTIGRRNNHKVESFWKEPVGIAGQHLGIIVARIITFILGLSKETQGETIPI